MKSRNSMLIICVGAFVLGTSELANRAQTQPNPAPENSAAASENRSVRRYPVLRLPSPQEDSRDASVNSSTEFSEEKGAMLEKKLWKWCRHICAKAGTPELKYVPLDRPMQIASFPVFSNGVDLAKDVEYTFTCIFRCPAFASAKFTRGDLARVNLVHTFRCLPSSDLKPNVGSILSQFAKGQAVARMAQIVPFVVINVLGGANLPDCGPEWHWYPTKLPPIALRTLDTNHGSGKKWTI